MKACTPCPIGKYQENEGQFSCDTCPYRLSSFKGSETCPFCAQGFYQKNSTALPQEIFQNPSENCLECPDRLSSLEGSDTCSFCAKGFYLKSSTALPEEIFQNPSENCLKCPLGTYDSTGLNASAASINDCLPCKNGTFSDEAGKNKKTFCVCYYCYIQLLCYI